MSAELSRRRMLQAGGVAGIAALATSRADPAAAQDPAGYSLANGYFSLAGRYGKLTTLAVDPTGQGRYEKSTCTAVYVGSEDLFDATDNGSVGVVVGADQLDLTGLRIAVPATTAAPLLDSVTAPLARGHTLGYAFTAAAQHVTRIGVGLRGGPGAAVTVTLYSGQPGSDLVRLFGKRFPDIATQSWCYLDLPDTPGGRYYLELSDPAGGPSWLVGSDGGSGSRAAPARTYLDRQPRLPVTPAVVVEGYDLGPTAQWSLQLRGPTLVSTVTVTPAEQAAQAQLTFVLPWNNEGYSIAYADDVLFSRFIADNGRYFPAQELKRQQPGLLMKIPTDRWVFGTGTGPYDLQWSMPGLYLHGSLDSTSLTLAMTRVAADEPAPLAPLALDVAPHTDAVPDFYPRFIASDVTRAAQATQFFYERGYAHTFANSSDYKDWENRILDWSDTGAIATLRKSLLVDTKFTDEGYVYAFSGPGWPFPNPKRYDTRHFITNCMFVLAVCRFYSWTGDRDFLTSGGLDRLRTALSFLLDRLGGSAGLLRLTSPDHTGEDQAIGDNYWDITSWGYLSAYENAYYYGALRAAAALEREAGNPGRADPLADLADTVRQQYNDTFWDDRLGRFVQCIDVAGVVHDYGCVYANLEALSFGLAEPDRARRVFDWIDHGPTELAEWLVMLKESGEESALAAGHTLGQSFTVTEPFVQVGLRVVTAANRLGGFTLTLRRDGPTGPVLASRSFSRWWDNGWPHLEVGTQPAGTYYLTLSDPVDSISWSDAETALPGGAAFVDDAPVSAPGARSLTVIPPYRDGPADVCTRWIFAPRATTRRNNFWYSFTWHPWIPWEEQIQDGGTSMYITGFELMTRARYVGGDSAWSRLCAVLDRWSEPDHISGGNPLYRGEKPQSSGAGAVGVDTAFPESGLAPAGFLYGILGVEAVPDALLITPQLPAALEHAGVERLFWRGRRLTLTVTRDTVRLLGEGLAYDATYRPGQTLRVPAPPPAPQPPRAPAPPITPSRRVRPAG